MGASAIFPHWRKAHPRPQISPSRRNWPICSWRVRSRPSPWRGLSASYPCEPEHCLSCSPGPNSIADRPISGGLPNLKEPSLVRRAACRYRPRVWRWTRLGLVEGEVSIDEHRPIIKGSLTSAKVDLDVILPLAAKPSAFALAPLEGRVTLPTAWDSLLQALERASSPSHGRAPMEAAVRPLGELSSEPFELPSCRTWISIWLFPRIRSATRRCL